MLGNSKQGPRTSAKTHRGPQPPPGRQLARFHNERQQALTTVDHTARPLTIVEVADYTATSPSTVRRWIARGQLRAIYFGRNVRIHPDDLERMTREVNPATYAHMAGGAEQ